MIFENPLKFDGDYKSQERSLIMARNHIFVENATVVSVEARQRPDGNNMTVVTVTVPARNNTVTTLVVSSGAQSVQNALASITQGAVVSLRANNLCAQKRQDGSVIGYAQLAHIGRGVQGEVATITMVALDCSVGQFAPTIKTANSGNEYVVASLSEYIRKGKDGKSMYLNVSATAFKQRFPGEFEALAGASQGKRFTLVLENVVVGASPQKGNPMLYGTVSSLSENIPFNGQQNVAQQGYGAQPQQVAPAQPQNNGYAQPAVAPAPQQGYQQNAAPQSAPQMGAVFVDDDDIPF